MIKKKILSLITILALSIQLTACQRNIVYENEPFMTELEFKEAFLQEQRSKIDNDRQIKIDYIDLYNVSDEIQSKLYNKTIEVLKDLNKNIGYSSPYYLHENFKYLLDNLIQKGDLNIQVSTSNGYYYVVLSSNFAKNPELDELRKIADYIGIRGAIGYNENGEENVDEEYLRVLIAEVNKQRNAKGLDPVDTQIEQIDYLSDYNVEDLFSNQDIISRADLGTASEITLNDDSEEYEFLNSQEDLFNNFNENNEEVTERVIRRLNYDAEEFNEATGSSKRLEYLIPNINAIFKLKNYDKLSGYSLYNWGATFPELKDKLKKANLVFVYKFDINQRDYVLQSFFPQDIKYDGEIVEDKGLFPSKFIESQLAIKLEEFHKAFCNKDVISLTSGNLIYPQDLGIYLLKYRDSINLISSDMILDKVLRKDNNTYVVKATQITSETIKEIYTTTGRFVKEWLIRFKIEDAQITVNDAYLTNIRCIRWPDSNSERGSILKLYSSENISNNVEDELKEQIRKELDKLQIALNHKTVIDDIEKDENDNIIYRKNADGTNRYGFTSRFNPDTTVLPSKDKEEDFLLLKTALIKYSTNKTDVYIKPQKWLWSADNQTALIISILYDYGKYADEILYNIVFSKLKDSWYIDELTEIEIINEGVRSKDILPSFTE